jgi:hypothetical protein
MSFNLPGVATTTSTPLSKSLNWGPLGAPPYRHVQEILDDLPNLTASSRICVASSLVGAKTSTVGPDLVLFCICLICMNPGSRYPRVFPDPVFAIATTS